MAPACGLPEFILLALGRDIDIECYIGHILRMVDLIDTKQSGECCSGVICHTYFPFLVTLSIKFQVKILKLPYLKNKLVGSTQYEPRLTFQWQR